MGQKLNFLIICNKYSKYGIISNIDLNHCEWDSTSAFLTTSPLHVNQQFIKQNFSMSKIENEICLCSEKESPDCYIDELGTFYPGVTVEFNLIPFSTSSDTALLQQNDNSAFACRGKSSVEIDANICNNLTFTLIHKVEHGVNYI